MTIAKHGLLVLGIACILGSCSDGRPGKWGRDMSQEIPSPSRKYVLRVVGYSERMHDEDWWHAKISILDADGAVAYSDESGFATWFPLRFGWDKDDRVWCYSGDEGIYYWQKGPNGWARAQWRAKSGLEIPRFLGLSEKEMQDRHERGF